MDYKYLNPLKEEFERIKMNHSAALRRTAARIVLGASVMRVFEPGTKEKLLPLLEGIDIDSLDQLATGDEFKEWFERELDKLAEAIKGSNFRNKRIYPGYKWGHTTKILCLYLREMVLKTHYFTYEQARRISKFLYTPLDSKAINRLEELGVNLIYTSIKQIDTPDKFYSVQELLGQYASEIDVPRVWFDDIWSER